ncbi:hypothetical protein GQ55_5G318500 [Panicum hallii var. hallii]|uniref:Uncharacterized protein n=1 Tax=Panicum hallii var. hallii TaxID=1504633 RepID=A0A2T7DLR3_9POAL|nr:hypothetical protein GQ55_5G318500 [Panicum hallii var. hallii]
MGRLGRAASDAGSSAVRGRAQGSERRRTRGASGGRRGTRGTGLACARAARRGAGPRRGCGHVGGAVRLGRRRARRGRRGSGGRVETERVCARGAARGAVWRGPGARRVARTARHGARPRAARAAGVRQGGALHLRLRRVPALPAVRASTLLRHHQPRLPALLLHPRSLARSRLSRSRAACREPQLRATRTALRRLAPACLHASPARSAQRPRQPLGSDAAPPPCRAAAVPAACASACSGSSPPPPASGLRLRPARACSARARCCLVEERERGRKEGFGWSCRQWGKQKKGRQGEETEEKEE